jgi:hypothetical protein
MVLQCTENSFQLREFAACLQIIFFLPLYRLACSLFSSNLFCNIQQRSYFHFAIPTWHFVFGKGGGCEGQPDGVTDGVMLLQIRVWGLWGQQPGPAVGADTAVRQEVGGELDSEAVVVEPDFNTMIEYYI